MGCCIKLSLSLWNCLKLFPIYYSTIYQNCFLPKMSDKKLTLDILGKVKIILILCHSKMWSAARRKEPLRSLRKQTNYAVVLREYPLWRKTHQFQLINWWHYIFVTLKNSLYIYIFCKPSLHIVSKTCFLYYIFPSFSDLWDNNFLYKFLILHSY